MNPKKLFFKAIARVWLMASTTLLLPSLGLAQLYSVKDLGILNNLAGQNRSGVNAINYHAQVAGVNLTNNLYRAFLYGGSWAELGTLGGTTSAALGINDAGRVVGRSLDTNGFNHAFLWTLGGVDGVPGNPQMKDLGTLGGDVSEADDINNAGQVAGYSATTGGDDHGFRYSSGMMADIHTASLPNNRPHSYAASINDAGHVTGTVYNNNFDGSEAFYYNGTNSTVLATPLSWNNAFALAINNSNHIAGYVTDNLSLSAHAVRWDNGTGADLGTLGGHYSYALAINNSNIVVGASFTDVNDTIYHAFVCISNTMIDLNDQLDATGTGWVLSEARAINDCGQIAGVGTLDGVDHAFLLSYAHPTITRIAARGSDLILDFSSSSGATYYVESNTNLLGGDWNATIGNITGVNGTTTVTNIGGVNHPSKFYRVRLTVP